MSIPSSDITTYVLLHGAWHGGWCWRDVKRLLEQAGHRVIAPTLTGLGERAHLLSADVGLHTHIEDVLAVLHCDEIEDCVLVGHSYAGIVLDGVVSRLMEREVPNVRLRHLVYLDAVMVPDGQRWCDAQTPEQVASRLAAQTTDANGVAVIPPPTPEQLGIVPREAQDRARKLMTPHPFRTYSDILKAAQAVRCGAPRTYVECLSPALPTLQTSRQRALGAGMPMLALDAGHDCMVGAPADTAQVLLSCLR